MTRLSLLPLAFLAMCSPAHAQQLPQCGPYPVHVQAWGSLHGEAPVVSALSAGGNMLLIIANPETGGWTAFQVSPQGLACAVDYGEGIRLSAPVAPGEPS